MWAKRRQSVTYTPKKFRKPSILMKARISSVDNKNPTSTIKVVVRVRPPHEKETESRQVVRVLDDNTLLFDPAEEEGAFYVAGQRQLNRDMLKKRHKNKEFEFDQVYDEGSTNDEVFQGTTNNFIASLLDGYNCSVFVYGATGAGKTFTMLGNKETPGIAYLTMQKLYNEINETKDNYDCDLKISYLEVYNETVKDLINPTSGCLNLRDDGKDGIVVAGIQTHQITCADELFNMLEAGNKNRTQHPTDANAESSRSHAVFQLHLRTTHKLTKEMKVSKLTMIDLAGSERGGVTGGKGARFSEGSNINKSLLALGNCVDALAEGHKHVPYRNSKLTRILKDSLGGNCKTIMVVNIAPSNAAYEETFNTLQYASRAKKINLKARKNVVDINLPYSQYKKINEDLRARIDELEQEIKNVKFRNGIPREEEPASHTSQASQAARASQACDRPEEEISRSKDVLKCLYELESKHRKEMLQYKTKISILDWRLQQKQMVRQRLHFHDEYLRDSQVRVDDSMERFKRQQRSYKDKVRANLKVIRDLQQQRELAIQEIRNKGLLKDLQDEIDGYDSKMRHENNSTRMNHFQELIVLQQNELRSSERIINMLCMRLNYFYKLLFGYGKVTEGMKNEFMLLVQHLVGIKGVSWGDEPDEYATLRKVMELKCTPNSSAGEDSPNGQPPVLESKLPGSSLSSAPAIPIAALLDMATGVGDFLSSEECIPLAQSCGEDSPFPSRTFQDSLFSPHHNTLPLNTTCVHSGSPGSNCCIPPTPLFLKKAVSIPTPEKSSPLNFCAGAESRIPPQLGLNIDTPMNDDLLRQPGVSKSSNHGNQRFCWKIVPPMKEELVPASAQRENGLKESKSDNSFASPSLCQKIDLNGTFVVRPQRNLPQKCLNETFVASPSRSGTCERKNVIFVGSSRLPPGKMKTFVTDKPLYLRRSPKSPNQLASGLALGPSSKRPAGVLTERNKFTLPSAPASKAGITKTDSKGKIPTSGQMSEAGDGGIPKENMARHVVRQVSRPATAVIRSTTLKSVAVNTTSGYPPGQKKIPRPSPVLHKQSGSEQRRADKTSTLPR